MAKWVFLALNLANEKFTCVLIKACKISFFLIFLILRDASLNSERYTSCQAFYADNDNNFNMLFFFLFGVV